jgi:amino acid adenylation domain-containing protein
MKKISQLFEKSVSQRENQTAILSNGRSISYKQLNQYAQLISGTICKNGITNSVIAIALSPGIDYTASLIGVNKSGNIFLPVDTQLPLNRKKIMLEHANATVLITDKTNTEINKAIPFDGLQIQLQLTGNVLHFLTKQKNQVQEYSVTLDTCIEERATKRPVHNPNAYLMYTSGSTGEPKAILGRNDSLCHFINWEIKRFKLQGITAGMLTSIGFDVSLRDIFVPLLAGGKLVIPDKATKENMPLLSQWVVENKVQLLHIVPSVFRLLAESLSENGTPDLKYLFFAGEAMYWKDIKLWQSKNKNTKTQLINLYGPSETTLAKLYYKIPSTVNKTHLLTGEIVPIGKPISDTEVFIVANEKKCNEGEPGEIHIATKYPSSGYYKAPALTEQSFTKLTPAEGGSLTVYKTGDRGYFKSGNVVFTGRTDNQIKIAGNRVELSEIEATLQNYKQVKAACVISDQSDRENQLIVAFYSASAALNKKGIVAFFQEQLPAYMVPHHIHYLETFPLTVNGKTDRNALQRIHRERLEIENSQNPARNPATEEKFEAIVKSVLKLNQFHPDRTLMEVGGSSLKAIQLIVEIYKQYQVTIAVPFLLNNTFQNVFNFLKEQIKENLPENDGSLDDPNELLDITPSQEQLVYVSKMSRNSSLAYNVILTYKVTGFIDPDKIKNAVVAVKDRYDIFRTTYHYSNNGYKQKIHPPSGNQVVFELKDVTPEEADEFLEREYTREFDLEKEVPMLRVKMFKVKPSEHYIVFSTHHITVDVWSLQILTRDFVNHYLTGKLYPSGFTQYTAFSRAYSVAMSEQRKEQSRIFWNTHFHSRCKFNLPTDFPRPETRQFKGATELIVLDEKLSSGLLNYVIRHNMTLFMFYISSLTLLLRKYSGSQEVVLGTPISLRDIGARFNDSVGYFLNMLPVKIETSAATNLVTYFEEVKNSMLEMYGHKYYPFSSIVKNLPYRYAANRNPLFDHMVVEIEQPVKQKAEQWDNSEGPVFELKRINDYSSKYDITFFIIRTGNRISLSMEYDTALYSKETIQFFLQQQLQMLQQILNAPETTVVDDILFENREFKIPVYDPAGVTKEITEKEKEHAPFQVSPEISLAVLEKLRKIILEFIPNINENKNFFEQGIDSIQSLRVISKINEEFETGIIILDLWTHNNIPDLALLITQKKEFAEEVGSEESQTTII